MVIFPAKPKETTAGTLMEESNIPLVISHGLFHLCAKLDTYLPLKDFGECLMDTKTMVLVMSGLLLPTPNMVRFLEKLKETPAGTLMEELNKPPTTSHGSLDTLT